jgi:hypothetical protein
MKKIPILLIVFMLSVFIQGCVDTFEYPTGVWKSDELGLTIDFDDVNGRGTLLVDGIPEYIVWTFRIGGGLIVRHPSENEEYFRLQDFIFNGTLRHRLGNRMSYTVRGKDGEQITPEVYTFVQVTDQ